MLALQIYKNGEFHLFFLLSNYTYNTFDQQNSHSLSQLYAKIFHVGHNLLCYPFIEADFSDTSFDN